jgi:hypothetical protein
MEAVGRWLGENWFALVQGVGIVAGLVFTGVSLRRDLRARRVGDLLTLTQQHRELWSEVHRRPELARIMDADADLLARPLTVAEERMLNLILVHFQTGWELARSGTFNTPENMAADVRGFFTLPLPRAVWQATRATRDPAFVRFIDGCLAGEGRRR